jgi:hypothetical protein
VNDVEWYDWTPDTAVKLCWRNWGTVVRVGPHPNLLSPRFQAWEKSIYAALVPVAVERLKALPAEKQWLFVGKPTTSLRDNPSFMRCLAKARSELGTTGYGIGEFVFGAKDYDTWHPWFTEKLAADPDCIFAALYNYDTMRGQPEIERAMLDAMNKAPN